VKFIKVLAECDGGLGGAAVDAKNKKKIRKLMKNGYVKISTGRLNK